MSGGRGRPRSAAADTAILEAAVALFAEQGVEGASIDQIARRAGVTRATLYRRWATKEALLVEAIGRLREGGDERVEDWGDVDADAFVALMTDSVPDILGRPDLARLTARLLGAARSHPELLEAYWSGYLAPRRAAFIRSLEAMKTAGRLAADVDPEVFLDMVSGALLYRLLVRPDPFPPEARRAYCLALLRTAGLKV
ncbi:TetR/AcrR family transcriptional regulator [Caulobacter mirabilis]|uniref:TetR family transcriptional regulator n=1 Tax=Caulobacter mirabilis TaxID=69666 RepID=A0A2D2AXM7_9CAUL|nr:TetR/AcrR family transcriptional regulator [Caulobacter mirabilis]ATQ42735.1 TetR family transcriptional regulator [Caulobacter mirabilis]